VKYIVGESEDCSDNLFQCFSSQLAEDSSPKLERSEKDIRDRISDQSDRLEKSGVTPEKERSIRRSLEHLYDRLHEEKSRMLDAVEELEDKKREVLRELEELQEFEYLI